MGHPTPHQAALDDLFSEMNLVYRGYVDDPRNTDHAWIETSAFHIHLPQTLSLPVRAGDDADGALWITVDAEIDHRYANLYASHKDMADLVADQLDPHLRARKSHLGYPERLEISDDEVCPSDLRFSPTPCDLPRPP